jgi:hypothetical protein
MNHAFVKDPLSSLESGSAPTQGSKIFLRSHMEWLRTETLRIAREISSAMAESSLKTYEMNARKRQRDAVRWERWEAANGRVNLFRKAGATPRRHVTSGASSPASSKSLFSHKRQSEYASHISASPHSSYFVFKLLLSCLAICSYWSDI